MSKNKINSFEKNNAVISEKVNSIPSSGIRKYFNLISSMKDVISLGIGEPDFITPWSIRESAIYALEEGYTMYTPNEGLPELRKEISKYLKNYFNISYKAESEILITVGVSEALDIALRAVINPGDEVIIPDPCYVAYPACVILAGGIPVSIPTSEEQGFVMKAKDVKQQITSRTKAIVIGNPSNPTGATYSKEDLAQIAELAHKYNLLVIADEIYAHLVYNVEHICFATLSDMKDRTILLNGFSKAFAMTGWRIGYAASNQEIIKAMTKIHQYTMLCAPIIGQMAAIEALKHGMLEIRPMVKEYNNRRQLMINGFKDIGLPCFEPNGAFYTFPSIKNTGMSSEEFAEKLLVEEKVVVIPGSNFGKYGEGYVRCCYAISQQEIEQAIKRINKFIRKHV